MATSPKWLKLDTDKAFLSFEEVGDLLGVSKYVVSGLVKDGHLPRLQFGREYKIATADVEEYVNAQRGAVREVEIRDSRIHHLVWRVEDV